MKYKFLKDAIYLLAQDIGTEETINGLICPVCEGGTSNDKSLSITRTATGLLYHCFRAGCGTGGFVSLLALSTPAKKKDTKLTPYRYNLSPLFEAGKLDFFIKKTGLTEEEVVNNRIMYNQERDSYCFPIMDIRGYEIGVVDRSYSGRKPKAISYWFNDVDKLHFPHQTSCKPLWDELVLVEDATSAIKVSRVIPACAVLGSHLTQELALYLARATTRLIIWFDEDAVGKAIALKQKYNIYFTKGIDIMFTKKDPKDLDTNAIRASLTKGVGL